MNKIGFGIIGTGSIAHVHAAAIKLIPGAELSGAYNIHVEKAKVFCDRFLCKAYVALEELLNDPAINVVCICTPSGTHKEVALRAIAAGKHCLIEKPLEITTERCTAIIEAAEKKGVKIATIFPSRFQEANLKLKAAVEDGRFGKVAMADVYVKWFRTPAYYALATWRGTWNLDGGGALMNQGIHSVDLLQWLMGPVESIAAIATNSLHTDIEAEDTISAVVRFTNGTIGNIACSTAIYPGFPKQIQISGSEGTAVVEENNIIRWDFLHEHPDDKRIMKKLSRLPETTAGASRPDDIAFYGHKRQIEDMMTALRLDTQPLVNGIEGRKSVSIIEQIYQSAIGRKIITTSQVSQ